MMEASSDKKENCGEEISEIFHSAGTDLQCLLQNTLPVWPYHTTSVEVVFLSAS